jgi:3-oxoacyl-[acyl-carrier protein] reductase
MKKNNKAKFDEFENNLPQGRMGTPQEVANVVIFLCSDEASLVNGSSISVDGGESRVI